MVVSPLSNVSLGTADMLAYLLIVLIAIFLVAGPALTYYYLKKTKRMKETPPASPA
jgi:preprotein translocase subunit SecG